MAVVTKFPSERKYEIWGVLMLALTSLLFLALVTDGYQGDSRRSITSLDVSNALGKPGAAVAGFLYILLGQAAHVIYLLLSLWAFRLLRHKPIDRLPTRVMGSLLLAGSVAGLLHIDFSVQESNAFPGGAIGAFVATLIQPTFGVLGGNVITVALSVVGILLATEFLFVRLVHGLIVALVLVIKSMGELYRRLKPFIALHVEWLRGPAPRNANSEWPVAAAEPAMAEVALSRPLDLSRIRVRPDAPAAPQELPFEDIPEVVSCASERPLSHAASPSDQADTQGREGEAGPPATKETNAIALDRPSTGVLAREPKPRDKKVTALRRKTVFDELPPDYQYPKKYGKPPLDLLDQPTATDIGDMTESLRRTGVLLEETLQTFGIEARVTDVTRGPTITRFELEPAPGVKVSRFMALADDLALALKAHRVRVEAPIPGKGKVGIEVPNEVREPVVIRELLESRNFRRNSGPLTLALGKDIAGDVVVADLASMPHLLVAGATGAGKTICVKTILASLLFSKTPEELQLMLIDPKMVELSIFNDIPHLITPVVIDPKKAATALNWLINEMEERYRLFAHLRVRNIEVYNQSVENGEIEITDENAESVSLIRKLPYIVCIIDELADLMMMARAEVEDAIARLAQLARAVGIHLIIATQRPSVDVLTGVIKANFPARISFQVSSRVDSRCILDEIGAERLIGRGDMLYLPAGQSKPTRVQGAFVSDEEMNSLIAYLKSQAPPQYRDEIEKFGAQQNGVEDLGDEDDELLEDAIRVVLETGQASISMVQRRLRVGYTRAARLIDIMELKGIVGPHVGSKAREILVPAGNNVDEGP